ncbi:ribosome biogenesis GTPase YqeH [Salisediminibacterium selenitireducens]|uniref:Ribosome biogenesis GTPase YqeH n=1 Tax=Bacillus selenitireducens (strain ATCC 700615 / DSM 15326 / MLS10) TaxID=439292 RepID=D6XWD2_BACIE|nr:ribosome biogenesis GTPase YqeH [Salisediminibacterium selenitireducens]ADH99886.1 ribosome biogenesis GTPase YqeH [[Bacillus] selenitireducens MLS10]
MGSDREQEALICAGCGVTIQTEHKEATGYTPPSALEREVVICQRCYRLKHYNEVQDVSLTDDDFLRILNQLGARDGLVVKVVDIFDFDGSWLNGLQRYVGENPVLLIGNKVDLLPKSVKRPKVIHWMKRAAKEKGLKPVDVHLMSAETGEGVLEAADLIEEYRNGKDVFIAGSTNTGKSTFINRLLKEYGAADELMITTSNIPGTTLDMIDVPLDDGSSLYDTPGIINTHQMAHRVDRSTLKTILPRKEVKPKIFQLSEEQSIFFAGLGRIDFLKGDRQSFIVFMSNDLYIHRTKLEKADRLYETQLGDQLSPPSGSELDHFPPLKRKEWKVDAGKFDIVYSGLGWVTVDGPGAIVASYVPEGVEVSIRPSLF